MEEKKLRISLGKRLRSCPSFRSFGVMSNWEDYDFHVKELIQSADEIFYPSPLYDPLFRSLGKRVFPRSYYYFMGNKIRQTDLFRLLEISHPRTRVYYGRHRQKRVLEDFSFPFVAKTPVGSSQGKGVFFIQNEEALMSYLNAHNPAYIQEYLPIDRDLRVVLIQGHVVHAYWRIHSPGNFRNNVAQGARISFDDIPEEGLAFARNVACRCRFDDVGLDVCYAHGRYYVIEANMVFGFEGFRRAGMDFYDVLKQMDIEGLL